ncbi:MAG: prolyl oligopeptidase family serine peptidase, partial [Chloroflexota bacterium]
GRPFLSNTKGIFVMKPLDTSPDALWKQRYRAPMVFGSYRAPLNPQRGIVTSNKSGIYQLYAWDVPTGSLTQITHQPTGLRQGYISADGRSIIYMRDDHGNEIGHFVRVPFEGGESEDITPDLAPYASFSLDESRDGSVLAFIAARPEGSEIYAISSGQRKLLLTSKASVRQVLLSADGKYAVVANNQRTGRNELSLTLIDTQTGEKVGELFDTDASIEPDKFSPVPGDPRFAASSDISGAKRPLIWNVATGARTPLDLPGIEGEVNIWDWSPDAKRLLLVQVDQAQERLYLYDVETGQVSALDHPAGAFSGGYFTPDGEIFVTYSSASQPACIIALDATTGQQRRVVLQAGDAPAGVSSRSVTFPSLDGTPIQGWLATPEGFPEGAGPFPTIIDIHGGPTAAQMQGFSAASQAWVDQGFAWLSVNYRGSTTFGKAYERAIWGRLGMVEVEDLVGARQWLVETGIADPDSILLTGWSYGGYLTLQALGRYPDLWAGGMSGIAIADWTTMYEDEAETLRGYQRSLFGGTPQETPEAHAAASPITYAADVRAPVMIIQGSNDTRCPARQMRGYEDKMRSFGKDIQIHWFAAGHGSMAMETSIEHQEIFMRFAYRVLG